MTKDPKAIRMREMVEELARDPDRLEEIWNEANQGHWELYMNENSSDKSALIEVFFCFPPLQKRAWEFLLNKHCLTNNDLETFIRRDTIVREAAGKILLGRHPSKRELRLIIICIPSLRNDAVKMFLRRDLKTEDLFWLIGEIVSVRKIFVDLVKTRTIIERVEKELE